MRPLILCLCLLLLVGCSRIPVTVDYQPEQEFSHISSYYWLPPAANRQPESVYNSGLVTTRVEQAVENELLSRGLLRTDNRDQADVLISYHIGLEKLVDIEPFMGLEGRYSRHRNSYGYGYGMHSSLLSQEYQQSTLVIDLLDPADKRLLWRGMAERRLKAFADPGEHDAFIAATVAAILAKYPPRP